MTENHLPQFLEIRNDCAEKYLHDSNIYCIEDAIIWFNNIKPMYWMIYYNNEIVGYFRTSNYSNINRNIYIGADIHKNIEVWD